MRTLLLVGLLSLAAFGQSLSVSVNGDAAKRTILPGDMVTVNWTGIPDVGGLGCTVIITAYDAAAAMPARKPMSMTRLRGSSSPLLGMW